METNHRIETTTILDRLPISISTLCFRALENLEHIHSYTHISFVIAGDARGVIGDTEHTFPAGSASITAPYLPHSFDTRESEDTPIVVHIRFNDTFFTDRGYRFFHYNKTLRFEERTIPSFISFSDDKKADATRIIRSVTAEFEKGKNMSYDLIAEYLAEFFRMTAEETPQEPIPFLTAEAIRCITKAVKYINVHYAEKLSIDDMLPITAMSRSLFTKHFKAITGMTFVNFLTAVRLGRALPKILTEEITLNELAAQTGLYNKTNLVRVFTSYFGMPPMKFREYFEKSSPGRMERHRMYQKRWKWLREDNEDKQ